MSLIDPHDDLAEALLDFIPTHRTNEMVVFDVGYTDQASSIRALILVCYGKK